MAAAGYTGAVRPYLLPNDAWTRPPRSQALRTSWAPRRHGVRAKNVSREHETMEMKNFDVVLN